MSFSSNGLRHGLHSNHTSTSEIQPEGVCWFHLGHQQRSRSTAQLSPHSSPHCPTRGSRARSLSSWTYSCRTGGCCPAESNGILSSDHHGSLEAEGVSSAGINRSDPQEQLLCTETWEICLLLKDGGWRSGDRGQRMETFLCWESAPARLTETLPPHRGGKLQLQAWVRVMNKAQLVKVVKA